ncbi:MAG: alpha/beta fold hydrolase [Rhodothermales bacterium]
MTDPSAWVPRLHVETSGPAHADVVLLLHGWGSSAALMRPIAHMLAPSYRVLAIDLPGHGLTPPPPEPWGVPEYARLVAAFLDREGLERVHIVGHSNGGRIALYMASDPDLARYVASLALISPSGTRPTRSVSYYVRSGIARALKLPIRLLPGRLRATGMDWLRHTWIWPLLGSSDFRQLTGVMRETFVKTANCYLEDRLARIEAPTIVLWGTGDDAISRKQMHTLVAGVRGAQLIELPGAGHYGYIDQPAPVAEALSRHLEPRHATV